MSEKTEQPTHRRKEEARRKGQVARSRMFGGAAVTAGGLFGLVAGAKDWPRQLVAWTQALLGAAPPSPEAALEQALRLLAAASLPALGGALLGGLIAATVSAGLQLNLDQLAPKLERIDPMAGLRRLASPKTALEVLKGAAVAALLIWLVASPVVRSLAASLRAVRLEGAGALALALKTLAPGTTRALVALVLCGAADYALARRRHLRELMMTRQEVKEEHKSSEGDPHHRAKRKSLHRQLAAQGPARGVRKATVLVVNPTHVAVALRYEPLECDAPYLVAKGQEGDALALRQAATREGIPIVRDVPLARSLIHYDVGEQIPEELYQAAAAVLQVALERAESTEPREEMS